MQSQSDEKVAPKAPDPRRSITLVRNGSTGKTPSATFEMRLNIRRGAPKAQRVLSVDLGELAELTQDRLDQGIQTITSQPEYCALQDPDQEPLVYVEDVYSWTGKGQGIAFEPKETTDPDRLEVFFPESAAANLAA